MKMCLRSGAEEVAVTDKGSLEMICLPRFRTTTSTINIIVHRTKLAWDLLIDAVNWSKIWVRNTLYNSVNELSTREISTNNCQIFVFPFTDVLSSRDSSSAVTPATGSVGTASSRMDVTFDLDDVDSTSTDTQPQ
jgi:hypothetical protein